ncbi:MAG: M15 family metallopeptidase [Minicystis sp.]
MTQQQQDPPKKHHTTRRGTGNAKRRRVSVARGAVDPPQPSTITYRALDRDPTQAAAFHFSWTRGSCWNPPKKIQCHVIINSPAGWERTNIVSVVIPALDSLQVGTSTVHFHRLVVPQFKAFFKAVEVKGLKGHLLTHVGAYFSRTITGNPALLSNHALGTAIDINAFWNGYSQGPAPRGAVGSVAALADFCADFGIYWGGWYRRTKDAMHFECVDLQSEATLRAACQTHGVDYDALGLGPP